ncbi:MAG: hypothetical protein AB7N91_14870 [Candidatus Tectimicrobiota bacterium]
MAWEHEPQDHNESADDNPALTRRALCAKAEELAVEMVRWKVWRVNENAQASVREAQAIQALTMVLIELLDDIQGSLAAAQVELARAVSLLGYTLQVLGADAVAEAEQREDAAFLRAHGLRFEPGTQADDDAEAGS